MKLCNKDKNQPNAKDVCVTVREARLETGQPLAAVAVIEQEGEQKKVLRITLPLGMQLPQGTRVVVDQDPPITGRYIVCIPNGCMADFEVDAAFVGKVKKSQSIVLQAINLNGQAASYPIPIADFAKANRARPPTRRGPGGQSRQAPGELERRARELQQRGGGTPAR